MDWYSKENAQQARRQADSERAFAQQIRKGAPGTVEAIHIHERDAKRWDAKADEIEAHMAG